MAPVVYDRRGLEQSIFFPAGVPVGTEVWKECEDKTGSCSGKFAGIAADGQSDGCVYAQPLFALQEEL